MDEHQEQIQLQILDSISAALLQPGALSVIPRNVRNIFGMRKYPKPGWRYGKTIRRSWDGN